MRLGGCGGWVAVEDAPEMARLLDAKMQSVEQIIEEEQAHRVQVAALSQMQLQAMERVAEQERELTRLSNLMAEHQAILRTSPGRPQLQSLPTSPPHNLARLRDQVQVVLPGTVNVIRGAADRVGQVPDLGNPPIFREDTLNDILEEQQEEEEVPVTSQRQVRFETSTPIVRPVEQPRERIQSSKVSQVPSMKKAFQDTQRPEICLKKASARAYRQQPPNLKSYENPRWLNLKEATPQMLAWFFSPG